ncbi:MAG: hypothetical protein ACI841_003140, partial [Planctomycetota bacterium]
MDRPSCIRILVFAQRPPRDPALDPALVPSLLADTAAFPALGKPSRRIDSSNKNSVSMNGS